MLLHMKGTRSSPSSILWHASTLPLPYSGEIISGHASTPFGPMHLRWTKDFLLAAGFEADIPLSGLSPTAQKLADLILANSPLPIRPLAVGTPFQLRVWQALTHIPYGTTASYRDIAHAVGSPNATRAVGTAIGANQLALLIPCHRVIRHNGHIGGFGWGIPTKQQLLTHEQNHPQNTLPSRAGQ